jgi:hypothetical protein
MELDLDNAPETSRECYQRNQFESKLERQKEQFDRYISQSSFSLHFLNIVIVQYYVGFLAIFISNKNSVGEQLKKTGIIFISFGLFIHLLLFFTVILIYYKKDGYNSFFINMFFINLVGISLLTNFYITVLLLEIYY